MTFDVVSGKKKRKGVINVGLTYVVDPMNPAKSRNRGRVCRVIDFVPVSDFHPELVAKIRYLDNNRIGRAELDDLLPIERPSHLKPSMP